MSSTHCTLCGDAAAATVEVIEFSEVRRRLETTIGHPIAAGVWERYVPAPTTTLLRCANCGLERFEPASPAGPDFYAALQSSGGYYEETRWEFARGADLTIGATSVLELGAGDGGFLRVLPEPTRRRVVAVESNPEAVVKLRALGAAVVDDLTSLGADERFDVVCAYNVIEHVSRPARVLGQLAERVQAGGTLTFSVPNRHRWLRTGAIEPLDCPPHHLTRWDHTQANAVTEATGLRLRAVEVEPAPRSQVEGFVQQRLAAVAPTGIARLIRRAVVNGATWNSIARSRRARAGGLLGHSLLFVLERAG